MYQYYSILWYVSFPETDKFLIFSKQKQCSCCYNKYYCWQWLSRMWTYLFSFFWITCIINLMTCVFFHLPIVKKVCLKSKSYIKLFLLSKYWHVHSIKPQWYSSLNTVSWCFLYMIFVFLFSMFWHVHLHHSDII